MVGWCRSGYLRLVVRSLERLRCIDMKEFSYRNIWISLALVLPLGAVATALFRDSEEAREVIKLMLVVVGVLVLHALDRRELRQREEDKAR